VEAERRQVTVLFRDMVGFTTFSERPGAGTTTYKTFQNSKIMIA
jgi:class 3 adenylate cyclase